MNDIDTVRWMIVFFHSDGTARDELDFPKVDFWHPSKGASMAEGARVLRELKERGDTRHWTAAGHGQQQDIQTLSKWVPVSIPGANGYSHPQPLRFSTP